MTSNADNPVADYRHHATRTNNPPAALASQGRVAEAPKQRYYYDPHLPPKLRFDDSGESDKLPELLQEATQRRLTDEEARTLSDALRNREPWLEWTGKREKRYFDVDPVALHIHERVSARAAMRVAARQDAQRSLWADPQQDYHEAVQFYRHDVDWSNRLILGDSLLVMNSLAKREDLAGKVQMIYIDPPYGISFHSNFQPFVRNRDVKDREADLTREPEMVKAYRDTWTLGIHTYLSYLRDRLVVARELLTDSGSVFVQIGDENVHLVKMILDEIFGERNSFANIAFKKKSFTNPGQAVNDYILHYAKNKQAVTLNKLYGRITIDDLRPDDKSYNRILTIDGDLINPIDEVEEQRLIAQNGKWCKTADRVISQHPSETRSGEIVLRNRIITPGSNAQWAFDPGVALPRLEESGRLHLSARGRLSAYTLWDDVPRRRMTNFWNDTAGEANPSYVVQTSINPVQRCMLMTTKPGDLVLDPTCGSGTTAYVAEQWGRRWITIDTSRVAVALARQRLLTAKFDYYKTEDDSGRIGGNGFKYKTVPHITLRSIAQNVALDPIFAKWKPVLDDKLSALNDALRGVDDNTRASLLSKLDAKSRKRPRRDYPITDADERRWKLPKDKWEHWEVPFDADDDYPAELRTRLEEYRKAWRERMSEVNACIAANADQETLVDQPEVERSVVRVSGPFTVEAVQPAEESLGWDAESPIGGAPDELDTFADETDFNADAPFNADSFKDSIVRLLKQDGVRFHGNGVMRFTQLETLADAGPLHAEGEWESDSPDDPRRVAVSVGPQYGPVTALQVEEALRAAYMRGYQEMVFAGLNFDGAAQAAIRADANPQVRTHMANISPDITMNDLLKETRDRELFSVSGLPRTKLTQRPDGEYEVEMEGVDIFDPVKNAIYSENADGVAAWFLDGDYDGRTFCTSQAFFPDSKAWDRLARSLKSVVEPDAFAAFSGTKSLPFPAGRHNRAAVKVIDPRGNEVMQVIALGDFAYDAPSASARDEFNRLASEWKSGRRRGADVAQMIEHPAYRSIVGMGEQAIPLMLEELEHELDHWFPALREVAGTSPIPEESKGNLAKMREAWLQWGRDEGYAW